MIGWPLLRLFVVGAVRADCVTAAEFRAQTVQRYAFSGVPARAELYELPLSDATWLAGAE